MRGIDPTRLVFGKLTHAVVAKPHYHDDALARPGSVSVISALRLAGIETFLDVYNRFFFVPYDWFAAQFIRGSSVFTTKCFSCLKDLVAQSDVLLGFRAYDSQSMSVRFVRFLGVQKRNVC